MDTYVTPADVERMAAYCRIGLNSQELASMTKDLNEVIDTLQPIRHFDLDGVEPTFHPIGDLSNVMRDDVEATSFTQAEALSNAPAQRDGTFLIPSILGEGGE